MTKQPATAPRERTHLDADMIVTAGLRLASTGGQASVSFRKLGAELGADPTAVYRHFRDKETLIAAMLDRLLESVGQTLDPGLPWRDRLTAVAHETVRVMAEHPAVGIEVGSISTEGPYERDAMEVILAAFAEAGLEGTDLIRFYGVFTAYVLTFAASTAAGTLAHGPGWADDGYWVPRLGRVDPDRHPHVAEQAAELEALQTIEVFTLAIDLILDAAEAAAKARGGLS